MFFVQMFPDDSWSLHHQLNNHTPSCCSEPSTPRRLSSSRNWWGTRPGIFHWVHSKKFLVLCCYDCAHSLVLQGSSGGLKGKQCHGMELRATSPNIKVLTCERWPSSQVGLFAESRVTEADRQPPPTGRVQGSSPFPQDPDALERGLQTLGIAPGAWGQSKQKREKKRDKLPWPWTRS